MNELGKLLKSWKLAERVLGKKLSDHLRNNGHIDIKAPNGMIYRIDGKARELYNLTTKESYCAVPSDVHSPREYPFADLVVFWWTYLHHKPEKIEEKVGPLADGHRHPIQLTVDEVVRIGVINVQARLPSYINKIVNTAYDMMGSGDITISKLEEGDLNGRGSENGRSEEGWASEEDEESIIEEAKRD